MSSFHSLGLSTELLAAVDKLGFTEPTQIQQEAIPQLIGAPTDFIGLAQTGTGKTAAFALPLIQNTDTDLHEIQSLILAPTRELGLQIAEQIEAFSQFSPKIKSLCVYGGAAITNQMKDLRKKPQILIATPGRLLDLIRRRSLNLNSIKNVVLDEADEMLNMGFKEDLNSILSTTPKTKSTWLFSATMPSDIQKLISDYLHNPIKVQSSKLNSSNSNIDHRYCVLNNDSKQDALCRFIKNDPEMLAVVFCRTKKDTQNLADALIAKNIKADAIHGDLSQTQRSFVLNKFKNNGIQVLVATDVAARGIDVDSLTHVFHYALPDDFSYYTHRSGRTARAGKKGMSIAFFTKRQQQMLKDLEYKSQVKFQPIEVPDAHQIVEAHLQNWSRHILTRPIKNKVPAKLLLDMETLFSGLSKEELIAKLVKDQIEQFDVDNSKPLNQNFDKGGSGRPFNKNNSKSSKGRKPYKSFNSNQNNNRKPKRRFRNAS
ncbi:MAG: DEAD/DEAH box helicase [Flavobacteriaceae bacterium]|nr:DEAD/DEAH box helicase [Flavobacteriaceae bacterium]